MTISIVIPVLDDGMRLQRLLGDLERHWPALTDSATVAGRSGAGVRSRPEVIVVDGGSRDDSIDVAKGAGARVLECRRGRGLQLDAGARAASGRWLWFLHADSGISPEVLHEIERLAGRSPCWGRFDVRIESTPLLSLTAKAMNWRSAVTGICTGDQGMFVHRTLLEAVGGVPRQPLMEDIELSKRLRRFGRPLRLRTPLRASARRWQTHGAFKTMILMWCLRIRYLCGASPTELERRYYG